MLGSGPRKGPLPEWKSTSDKTAVFYYSNELDPLGKNHGDIIISRKRRQSYVVDIQFDGVKFLLIEYYSFGGHIIPLEITASIENPIKFYDKIGNNFGTMYIELDSYKHRSILMDIVRYYLTPHPTVTKFIYKVMYHSLRAVVSIEDKPVLLYKVNIGIEGNFSEDIDNFILEQSRK